jgi:hypothetical protein
MSVANLQIDYAHEAEESRADYLLRRIVGWAAVVYGAIGLLQQALHMALARGWLSRPPNMMWSESRGWGIVLLGATLLTDCAFLLAGALLLRRSALGIPVLRGAAAFTVVATVASVVHSIFEFGNYGSYWSQPASAGVEALGVMTGLWVPLLLAALTFRPAGRRLA